MRAKKQSENRDNPPLEAILDGAVDPSKVPGDAFLLMVSGPNVGRMYGLDEQDKRIGRSRQADIRIDLPAVSQWHAKVSSGDPFHVISDLGSTNGVFVNGIEIEGEIALRPGDVIGIGEVRLAYVNSHAEGTERTQAIPRASEAELIRVDSSRLGGLSAGPERSITRMAPHLSLSDPRRPGGDLVMDKLVRGMVFFRLYARTLVLVVVLAMIGGATSLVLWPPLASAFFEISLKPNASVNPVDRSLRNDVAFFDAAEKNFRAPALIAATLRDLGRPDDERSVKEAAARLKFESVALNNYRGQYKDADASIARRFLDRHVQLYLNGEIDKTIQQMKAQVDFISSQLEENENALIKTEQRLREFKKKNILNLPEFADAQLASQFQLIQRRDELQTQMESRQAELALAKLQLQREDSILEQKVVAARPYEQEIAIVQNDLERERARGLNDDHPDVVRLESQLSALRRVSFETVSGDTTEIDRRANPVHRALQAKVGELRVQAQSTAKELGFVKRQISQIERIAKNLPEIETAYAQLTRSYTVSKDLHDKLFAQLKTSQLQLELERVSAAARYEIIVPPTVASIGIGKGVVIRVAGSVALAFDLAVAMIFAKRSVVRVNQESRVLLLQQGKS